MLIYVNIFNLLINLIYVNLYDIDYFLSRNIFRFADVADFS